MSEETFERLGVFLAELAGKHGDPETVFALRLAETGLAALRSPVPVAALAVIGPTQTGKSTVVNLIAGDEVVETSPLAAHTQRASVLAVNTEVPAADIADVSGLDVTPTALQTDSPACLIWDTPDFDSNAAHAYRQQVARVCALVDLIVVVLSKEKYADQSVWRVLETLAPLQTPTILCLNKCDATELDDDDRSDAAVLLPVIRRRLADGPLAVSDTPVTALPRLTTGDTASRWKQPAVQAFRALVIEHLDRRPAAARRAGLARLLDAHWADWTAPVERELACQRAWTSWVDEHTEAFMARYRSEYIDHTRHHDVAQKAILGLLELLEIPALAGPMTKTRRVLTWPIRRLAGAFTGPEDGERDQELVVLDGAIDHLLLSLRSEALEHPDPWWRAAAAELADRAPALRGDFREAVEAYRAAFQPRIDELSRDLYEQLRGNPVTLNALRAARVSADAGGVVLAIKTGGLGLYDALFAPAVISLTSWLTESTVGQYLRTVIAGLKREQVEQVSAIVQARVAAPLAAVRPRGPGLFGVTQAELEAARRDKEALRP